MKAKKISFVLSITVVVLCIIMLSDTLLSISFSLSVASAADLWAVDYDKYTDSDTLLGGSKTLRDYASSLHHSTVSWNGTKYTVTEDDPIVQIVPKSLFVTKGEYLHIGKEYGFFVKTTADTYRSVHTTSDTVDPYNNNVEVLVFDITTNTNIKDVQNPDLITVKVEPLFQYRYAYIDYRSSRFFSDNNTATGDSFYLPYSIATGESFVVPKPLSKNSTSFNQTWNYFLKDISISSTLLNEQELNETDDEYMASNDNGYFITQFDYKYDGFVSKVSTEDKVSLGLNVVGMICGAISFVPGPVGATAGVLGLILGEAQTAASISVVSNNGSPTVGTSVSNGQITAVNKFTTKAGQVANYTSPVTGKPCLIKNATCMINGDDQHGNPWFRDGDNVTGYFRVSHTADWHTRLEREIALTVIDKDGTAYQENTTSQYKFAINEPVYKSIDLDEQTKLILLADGDNYFEFAPKHTSDYQFAFAQSNSAEVFFKTANAANYTKATVNGGKYSCRMNANTIYNIKIHSANKSKFNITMSPSLTMPSISPKSEYMIKYVPTAAGAYTFKPSNTGFLIKSIYQNTANSTYDHASNIDRTLNCKDVDAVVKKGAIYYIVLTNNTTTSASSGINTTACNTNLSIGSNSSKAFTGGENYRYYKFVLNGKNNVNFNFKGADNSTNTIEFSAYNSSGDYITPTDAYYDGYLRLGTLSAGTYYIGVRVKQTVALTPEINTNQTLKVWKQLIGGVWKEIDCSKEHILARGKQYYFSFWVDTTVIRHYEVLASDVTKFALGNNFSVTIKLDAYDYELVYLEARSRRSEQEDYMSFTDTLKIRPVFDVDSELESLNIDYVNKINLSMTKPVCVQSMTYVIKSNTFANAQLTNLYSETITGHLNKDFFDKFCAAKATKAKFILQSIIIRSGPNNSITREVTINREYNINCMEQRFDSATSYSYISNELHLYNLRNSTRKYKILSNDINLNYFANWDILSVNAADSTIDGGGHTITGMRFAVPTGSNKHYGFVDVNDGIIRSLNFTGVSITGKSSDKYGDMRFGTIAAINNGKVKYCKVSGKIDVYRRDGVVGGIVAINNRLANVEDCIFGYIGNRDQNYLGNSGDIGGIAGRNMGGSVQFCETKNATIGGDVDHCANSYGGIVGYMEGGGIAGCKVTGIYVKVTNGSLISGYYPSIGFIVGNLSAKSIMDNCYITNCEKNITKLTVGYRKNCFKGTGGCYGKCSDSSVYNIHA